MKNQSEREQRIQNSLWRWASLRTTEQTYQQLQAKATQPDADWSLAERITYLTWFLGDRDLADVVAKEKPEVFRFLIGLDPECTFLFFDHSVQHAPKVPAKLSQIFTSIRSYLKSDSLDQARSANDEAFASLTVLLRELAVVGPLAVTGLLTYDLTVFAKLEEAQDLAIEMQTSELYKTFRHYLIDNTLPVLVDLDSRFVTAVSNFSPKDRTEIGELLLRISKNLKKVHLQDREVATNTVNQLVSKLGTILTPSGNANAETQAALIVVAFLEANIGLTRLIFNLSSVSKGSKETAKNSPASV